MLSIIIPVYNAELYLNKAVESIKSQSYRDWELILIDDGSTDNSAQICDDYERSNPQIHTIHKTNGGVSSARNLGLNYARGQFVMFLDADDWVGPTLCEDLMNRIDNHDLAIGGYRELRSTGEKVLTMSDMVVQVKAMHKVFAELYKKYLINTPASKIYRADIAKSLSFREDVKLGEDLLFNLDYLRKCKTIVITTVSEYTYNCLNENSATKQFRDSDIDQIVLLYRESKAFLQSVCNDHSIHDEIEEQLCVKGINQIQLIVYSSKTKIEKLELINKLFHYNEFLDSCNKYFKLPLKMAIPKLLCSKESFEGVYLFFSIKGVLSKLISRL